MTCNRALVLIDLNFVHRFVRFFASGLRRDAGAAAGAAVALLAAFDGAEDEHDEADDKRHEQQKAEYREDRYDRNARRRPGPVGCAQHMNRLILLRVPVASQRTNSLLLTYCIDVPYPRMEHTFAHDVRGCAGVRHVIVVAPFERVAAEVVESW